MKRIIFVVPFFGPFPEYSREWAFSAGYLKEQGIDFLLITDQIVTFELPANIRIWKLSFEEFKAIIQAKFDFPIAMQKPYKLCDFRPAWGYILEEKLRDYDFWGNCDIDQIWGDVRSFITNDILDNYDRIHFLGHFTLYRNVPEINALFRKPGAIYGYQKVFSDEMHYSFCEHSGIMRIAVKNGISNYIKIDHADLSPRYTRMLVSRQPNYDHQILYWENGHVYRAYVGPNGRVGCDEYMYFHFQKKRPASLRCWDEGRQPVRIIYHADAFVEDRAEEVTAEYIRERTDFVSHRVDEQENSRYVLSKAKSFIGSPIKKKILWLKQKAVEKKVVEKAHSMG